MILRGEEVAAPGSRRARGGPAARRSLQQDECLLQPGDIFIGYTDGISEAMNEQTKSGRKSVSSRPPAPVRILQREEMIEAIFRRRGRVHRGGETIRRYDAAGDEAGLKTRARPLR